MLDQRERVSPHWPPTQVLVTATPTPAAPWLRQLKGVHGHHPNAAKSKGAAEGSVVLGARGCRGTGVHTRVLGARKRRQGTGQERGHPRSPFPTPQVPGPARPSLRPQLCHAEPSPHRRAGPGFNHPSITRRLLLLTAHLLAFVKHAVNSERNSPALPEQRNGQHGAGQSLPATHPPAAHSQHRSQRCREGPGCRIGPRLLTPSAAMGERLGARL